MARKARSATEKKADVILGQRIAGLRKERGYTQVELAEKMDIIQTIISDYERGKLRPHPEMLAKLATVLQVSADQILGLTPPQKNSSTVNRRFLRRLHLVDKLPLRDQEALLRTIDAFLEARKAS
jgi:transcriptional regulator with XRE-family HTH domain